MKKMMVLALALMLTLTACGTEEASLSTPDTQPVTTEAATEATLSLYPSKFWSLLTWRAPAGSWCLHRNPWHISWKEN